MKRSLLAIDLFSGCGGLTLGLKRAGYKVVGAVELDELAANTYSINHPRTKLYKQDIRSLAPKQVLKDLGVKKGEIDLIAGCPPCQGFSTMRTGNGSRTIEDPMNDLVFEFARFVLAMRPRALMMENVPGLAKNSRIEQIVKNLEAVGYSCKFKVANASDYGAPQRRRRMILIGSLNGEPSFASPSKRQRTVRTVIGNMPKPLDSDDPMHSYQTRRSSAVLEMMRLIPKDGGSRSELPSEYHLRCHTDFDGYKDVYGRMAWGEPSPTITGGCINPSKGRFLHPEQDRAITLREAALLQGFPMKYRFDLGRGRYPAAQMIGNAFPPIFAQKHAEALKETI